MKRIFSLIALLALVPAAHAEKTAIATQPLLNIDGTGSVKPNLMLIYDNSGSMEFEFTPDYVGYNMSTCRSKSTIAGGQRTCTYGDAPFNSAIYNKQYYNPAVRYEPPVDHLGAPFKSMTSANTSAWESVPVDGFLHAKDPNTSTKINLRTGFPDLKWCSGSDCRKNTTRYTYPNDAYSTASSFTANPYYYTLRVSEYCTDTTLTNCKSTTIGAPAPAGYPIPAPVRWCNSTALDKCQAKYIYKAGAGDKNYIYPRFADPAAPAGWFSTITILPTKTSQKASIASVDAAGEGIAFTLTNGEVAAANGTDTTAKQEAVANSLAASIVAKLNTTVAKTTRGTALYTACLRVATSTVKACSTYDITLPNSTMVGIVPLFCPLNKLLASGCITVKDGSRAEDISVSASNAVRATLTVQGTSNSKTAQAQVLSGLSLGSVKLFDQLTLPLNASAGTVAKAIADKVNTGTKVKAYSATYSGIPAICGTIATGAVCLVTSEPDMDGQSIKFSSLSNNYLNNDTTKPPYLTITGTTAATEGVPTGVSPMGLADASPFVRTDIISTKASYPKAATRTDCTTSDGACSYEAEMENFANWYAYYRSRNLMMKTSVGHAFQPINENYKVGIVALSVAAAKGDLKNRPKAFTGADRKSWYDALYGMNPGGSTPLREALHAVGLMYAHNYSAADKLKERVVEFGCQQNFTFLTTDGYWNGPAAADVKSNDEVESEARFCSQKTGCVDKSVQAAGSLADVALYWYNGGSNDSTVSLRPDKEDPEKGLVSGAEGENTRLHMNTYTLGLGVDGLMTYSSTYISDVKKEGDTSDLRKIIDGVATGCPWNDGKAYVWPDPVLSDTAGGASHQSRVDDLWHAAINGHGKYFSASDRLEVIDSMREALSHIKEKSGAAAAAATSTPNVSFNDNDIFSANFTTVKWIGELQRKTINPTTGVVNDKIEWTAAEQLGKRVSLSTDTRKIYMLNTSSNSLKNFNYSEMTADEKAWFDSKCALLTQCVKLKSDEIAVVNNGANIVNWLRGQQQHADDKLLREYTKTEGKVPLVLGDIASSKPAYLRNPRKSYPDEDYIKFQEEHSDRAATVFVGANDGMLHAFAAANGEELWAYAPRITMKKLYRQTDLTYGVSGHQFTVDGSPELADVKINGKWRTVLVAGLNGGGRGYYALDVTDPANPIALWELCADSTVCANNKADIGLTFGNPQFGTWVDKDNKTHWVVFLTSGYNNVAGTDGVAAGSGKSVLFVVDVATGTVLEEVVADKDDDAETRKATPSGLARITAISNNPHTDPKVTHVFGGDNLGRMWRFDFTAAGTPTTLMMADAGIKNPITARPDVTTCYIPGKGTQTRRVVAFGSGRLLDTSDIKLTDVQSAYVLFDTEKGEALGSEPKASMAKQTLTDLPEVPGAYTMTGADKIDMDKGKGWYVEFDKTTGERVNLDPKIVDSVLNVVTNVPSESTSCSVGGTSKVYQINVCTGAPVGEVTIGEGKNKKTFVVAGQSLSKDSAAVGSIVISLPSGERRQITTKADGSIITTRAMFDGPWTAKRAGWRRVRN